MHKAIIQILERLSDKEATVKRCREQAKLAGLLLGAAALMLILLYAMSWWSFLGCVVLLCVAFGFWIWGGRALSGGFDAKEVARKIEENHPELQALLLTAVEQKPDRETGELSFLQDRVIKEAVDRAREQRWVEDVSVEEMARAERLSRITRRFAALAVFLPLVLGLMEVGPSGILPTTAQREPSPATENGGATSLAPAAVEVIPGDAEIERGSRLPISAAFGKDTIPVSAQLLYGAGEDALQSMTMVKSLEDPVFGVILPEVNEDFVYQIQFGEQTTDTYQITTFEYPRLDRADVTITPPSFIGSEPRVVKDVRQVSAYEDSLLEFQLQLNKAVESIGLRVEDSDAEVAVERSEEDETVYLARLTAVEDQVLVLELKDVEGRVSKEPARLEITVLYNEAPEVVAVFPKRDIQASPLEEVTLQGAAKDDFGVLSYGLSYQYLEETTELPLGGSSEPVASVEMEYLLALEDLGAEPDQLISYYFWAEDKDREGQLRRAKSDIYFIEVRPFLKRYREGSGGGGGGGGSQPQQEAAKQKEMIAATHRVIESPQRDPAKQKEDIGVLIQGQEAIVESTLEMKENLDNAEAQQIADSALAEMDEAIAALDAWRQQADVAVLENAEKALGHEMKAYDWMLKLRGRDVNVVRAEDAQGGGGGQQDPQLEDMNLKEKENRYQNQNQASQEALAQQRAENQEALEYLNRLKELSKRQEALTDKLKELESQLEVAENEAEKEKIERELKRLRDQQREMLREVDELRRDMDQSETRSELAEAREQLRDVRDRLQEAADAMGQNENSQAIAEATRAEEKMQQLNDELRLQAANRFADEMRALRDQALEISERQEEIEQQLTNANDPAGNGRPSLRDESSEAQEALAEQKEAVENLVEETRQVAVAAELSEPRLSQRLEDTLRSAQVNQLGERLTQAADMINGTERSLPDPQGAQLLNEQNSQDIAKLTRGIEEAAESILGDETSALRLAQNEVQQLIEQLENQAPPTLDPSPGQPGQGQPQGQGQQAQQSQQSQDPLAQNGQGQQGQGQQGQGQQGQGQQGQGQQGQGQQGQGQQGQGQQGQGQQGQGQGQLAQNGQGQGQGQQGQGQGQLAQNGQGQGQGQQGQGQGQLAQNGQGQGQGQQGQGQGQLAQNGQGQGQQGQGQGQLAQNGQGQGQGQQGQGQGQLAQNGQGQGQQGQGQGQLAQNGQGQGQGQQGQRQGQLAQNGQGQLAQNGQGQQGQGRGGPGGGGNQIGGGGGGQNSPFGGDIFLDGYRDWMDRLADVEGVLDNPALREQVSRVRGTSHEIRGELTQENQLPTWDLVQQNVLGPLVQLNEDLIEELSRLEDDESLAPVDRDPVLGAFTELVQRYYETLGKGE